MTLYLDETGVNIISLDLISQIAITPLFSSKIPQLLNFSNSLTLKLLTQAKMVTAHHLSIKMKHPHGAL